MKPEWICSLCNAHASSKCPDFRSVFIKSPEGMTNIAHMLIQATTLVQWKEDPERKKKYIECSVESSDIEVLSNVLSELAKCPAVLNELLCNHDWCLAAADDCELSCKAHRKIGEAKRKRPLPSEQDVIEDLYRYEDLCKRARTQLAENESRDKAIRTIKRLFDTHAQNKPWNENAVIVIKNDEPYKTYAYGYNDSGVFIEYLSRVTLAKDDIDVFVDALVEIDDCTVYKEVKDDIIIDKSKSIE